MKKTLIAFLCTFIALPAVADNYIKFKASAIEDTINTMVPESHRAPAADEYQKQMDSTTGKISVMGIYKVCAAAGFNINNTNGYNGCRLFINTIAEKSGFGSGSANQQNCKTKFNGIWTVIADGTEQCVGRDGHKLVYHASCDGAGGDCIRDFATLQTQEPNAREFIQTYGQQKNLQFTCWYTFDKSRWQINNPRPQDYIKCSAGGKAYEFEFDDLIQDPGKTAVESENTALCEMFGGKIVKHPDDSIEKQWQSCEVSKEICNGRLHNLAIKIGHNVMYQGYCRLSRTVEKTSVVGLKTLPGVDSRVFYNTGAQMRAGMAKTQTEEYLRTKFPNETHVNCDPNPKILNEGFGINRDYVMTCTVGSKQVDFIFHDLTEGNDARAATGMDAMQCIISGGTFQGESCRGPTQAECDALDAALRAKGSSEGAKWDDDIRACIMGNAMKTYKRDVTTGYIVGAVVIVGGTIAVIGTGGAAAPAIIGGAEMLVTDLAINWAIDANHRRLSKGAATRFGDFIEDADKCTDEQCALQVLKKHYKTLSGVIDDLNTEDHATIDAVMDRLIGLVQTEFVACGTDDAGQVIMASPADCAMQKSRLRAIDYFGEWTEFALVVGSIAIPAGYFTNKFMKMKNVSKLAKLDDATDIKQTGVSVLNGLDPNFTKGTRLDATELTLHAKRLELKQQLKQGKIVRNTDDILLTPEMTKLAAADKWRHPSNPTRIYTTEEMSDIIHRTRQYGGDPSGLTGWEPVFDDVTDVAKSANNASTVPHIMLPKSPVSALDNAKQKLVDLGHGITDFDGLINDFVHNNGPFPGHFTRNTLTDSEFDALVAWFKSEHNLTLDVDNYGILKIDRPTITTVDPVAAMKAKLRSGQNTSPLDLAKQTPTNNGGSAGYKIMDDGTIIRETPEAVITKTTQAPMPAIAADDVADVINNLPSRAPQTLAEEKDVLDKLEDFFSANPNKKPSSMWSARSAAEDAYIKKYGPQLDEIGEHRLQSVLDDGYGLGNIDWEDLDFLKRERLGISDAEYDFIKSVENWLNLN